MKQNMNLFVRQKGRQRGNSMLPISLIGHGSRAERRAAEREARKQERRSGQEFPQKKLFKGVML